MIKKRQNQEFNEENYAPLTHITDFRLGTQQTGQIHSLKRTAKTLENLLFGMAFLEAYETFEGR